MPMIDQYADGHRRQGMSRIMHGLITDVDTAIGMVTVQVVEVLNVQKIELSFAAFSYMGLGASSSSWFRYMPQVGSAVLIGYRPNGKPEILGYTPLDYSRLTEFKNNNSFKEFRPLRPGEFDLRSSGGAGFYASALGEFIMGGGPVQTTLDAQHDEARMIAGVSGWTSGTDEMRFGTVKRKFLGPAAAETAVPAVGSSFKEFSVAINSGLTALKKVLFQLGDVFMFGDTVPVTPDLDTNTGLPIRGRLNLYDTSGLTSTSFVVNTSGDMTVSVSPLALAVGMQILGVLNKLLVSFLQITLQAVTNFAIQAGVTITIDAPQVIVGGGILGLMTEASIPILLAHRHTVVPDPTLGILVAEPSVDMAGLATTKTIILRAS